MASTSRSRPDPASPDAPTPAWLGATALLDQIPDGLIVADADGAIVFVNAAAQRLHGVKRLGVTPDGYAEAYQLLTLDGAPFPADRLPLTRAVAGETVADARWRIRRPDGSEIVAIGSAAPFLDSDGNRRGAMLTLRDDSARLAAEVALGESEERFRSIANVAPAPVWVTGPSGIEFANQAFAEIAERPPAELLGDAWMKMIHADDIPGILAVRDESWRTGRPYGYEARFQRAGGEWRWLEVSCAPRLDAKGAVAGYVGMAVDITERRRAEAELRGSEKLLRAMFDNAGVGMVLMDRECMIAEANAAFAAIVGRAREALPGTCCLGLTHPDDLPANRSALDALAGEEQSAVALEKRYLRVDGSAIWMRITLSLVGEQVLGIVEDVTGRKTAELHLRLMIDELNHRVKNTLAVVQAVAQQTFSGSEVPDKLRRSFEGRLAALSTAHDLLTRASWESAELSEVAHEAVTHHAGRVRVEGPPTRLPPKIAVSLAMALHELCTNAVKYGALSRPEGEVTLTWETVDGRLHLVWAEQGGPPVAPPSRRGFGTRMIERALASDVDGRAELEFRPEGVVCRIEAALPPLG